MVGFDARPPELTHTQLLLAGGLSGFTTRALCQPLDVVKIRMQLQVEPITRISAISKYQSLPQTVRLICKEESIRALWKGHVPAQYLSVIYGVVQFGTFELLTEYSAKTPRQYAPVVNFCAGAASGVTGTAISFPFDVVRTRLVAQGAENIRYRSVPGALALIYRQEGAFALYRGIAPTLIQVAPHTGVSFMSFKMLDSIAKNIAPNVPATSVISGGLAGLISKMSIYPLDLIRKRLQVQGFRRSNFGQEFRCDGLVDCARQIVGREGWKGLFKGLQPSLLKAMVTTALHFSSYDLYCHLFICSTK